jgi:O-methyltransferase
MMSAHTSSNNAIKGSAMEGTLPTGALTRLLRGFARIEFLEAARYLIYRTPLLRRLMSPKYRYKVSPGQLAALVGLIDATRQTGGSVIEIGVANGRTSVFLLEHLETTGDPRHVLLFDTFNGFTAESVDFEVAHRGKIAKHYNTFRYGDEQRLRNQLTSLGYHHFEIFPGDASEFDWSTVAPIAVVHLDIDLYVPTKAVLDNIWPHIVPGGGIVIDDCREGPYDGSLQAYQEFIAEHGMPFERAGSKGGVLRKNA